MPATKSKLRSTKGTPNRATAADDGVLTLREAAAYLRLAEDEVTRLVREQGMPGRRTGDDWRFLKSALRAWLSASPSRPGDFWETQLGAFKDDPGLHDLVEDIYRKRGRPSAEAQ